MDIAVVLQDITLNIRSAVLIETAKGYIFERDSLGGYYFVIGGRVKIDESSVDAAKREVREEIGITIENIKLKAIAESFFSYADRNYHEICFYYYTKLDETPVLPHNYFFFTEEAMKAENIQPKVMQEIVASKDSGILHFIIDESDERGD